MDLSACSILTPRRSASRRRRGSLLFYNDLLVVWDCAAGFALGYVTDIAYMHFVWRGGVSGPPTPSMLHEMVLCSLIAALILREPKLATDRRLLALPQLLAMICRRGALAVSVLFAIGVVTRALGDMARLWLTGWVACFACSILVSRLTFVAWVRTLQAKGGLREAVAVIGFDGEAEPLASRLGLEVEVVAIADALDVGPQPTEIADLLDLACDGGIDTVVLASPSDVARLDPLLKLLQPVPVQVTLASNLSGLGRQSAALRRMADIPMAILTEPPLKYGQLLAKSCLDRVVAALLLILLSPLLLVLGLLVALDSPGPVIFRQRRSGWGGRGFTIVKFRSMKFATGTVEPCQTSRDDQRFTRIGARLRRSSLDELPQLWNVLMGEMSLVGPRPHADSLHVGERAGHALVAEYARRQRVKPGLTGWAQVNGFRGAATDPDQLRKRIEYDLFYIDNWSLLFDLEILARTPLALLSRENAF